MESVVQEVVLYNIGINQSNQSLFGRCGAVWCDRGNEDNDGRSQRRTEYGGNEKKRHKIMTAENYFCGQDRRGNVTPSSFYERQTASSSANNMMVGCSILSPTILVM